MGSVDVDRLLRTLREWEGAPYHHQGRNAFGVDCIGLALAALAEQGIDVDAPRDYSAAAQGDVLIELIEQSGLVDRAPIAEMQPGDILVFRIRRDPQHVSIYMGDEQMIHSATGLGVRIATLSPLWRDRLIARFTWRT